MERWGKLVAVVGGLTTLGGGIVTGMVTMSRSSAAAEMRPVERRVTILETKVEISLPSIERKLDVLIEAVSQREWRDHRVIIPTPNAPADAGMVTR